jgi:methylthioribose-1-phosphate isomerase
VKFNGKHYRTVWMEGSSVFLIDQTLLPFEFKIVEIKVHTGTCDAIRDMTVRGAGAIGAAAGFAMAQAFLEAENQAGQGYVDKAKLLIENTRPTAKDLFAATGRVYNAGMMGAGQAVEEAQQIATEYISHALAIGQYGEELIRDQFRILTHCNAGWLAFVDYGSALSPVYAAWNNGKKLFVYADETRPRSQGARLTAWELLHEGIPHCIIPDNAAATLMSQGKVDIVITGADRIAVNGDVANKIGTLEKAILAKEFGIPFYIAAPLSTFDRACRSGAEIIIEERSENEVLFQHGPDPAGIFHTIRVANPGSAAWNPAFDVTPAKYITAIITEKGIIKPSTEEILNIIP